MRNAYAVSRLLKGRTSLFHGDFRDCVKDARTVDVIYLDPPYQGTTYGTDKRYAAGFERECLIEALHIFDASGVPYVLSFDGQMGEKTYGAPLPDTIDADYLAIHAGRSSQATISGRNDETKVFGGQSASIVRCRVAGAVKRCQLLLELLRKRLTASNPTNLDLQKV